MSNISIKFSGLTGSSTQSDTKTDVELLSFSHEMQLPMAADGVSNKSRTSGNVRHAGLLIVKMVDEASPKLFLDCCSGKILPSATLTVKAKGESGTPEKVFSIEMRKVIISDVSYGAGESGEIVENIVLNYTGITWDQGKVSNATSWNLEKNDSSK